MLLLKTFHPLKYFLIFTAFFLTALLIRLPFFFNYVWDWNESTYILMGQDLLNGHLPYVHLWENKPPLLYTFFAAAIFLFGKSVFAIRLAGTLWISLASLVLYETGRRLKDSKTGWWSGFILIIYAANFRVGESVLAAHVAFLPLSFLIFRWLWFSQTTGHFFWIGLCIGFAGLIRTNLFFLIFPPGLMIVWEAIKIKNPAQAVFRIFVLGAGCFLLPALIGLLYFFLGHGDLLIASLLQAPTHAPLSVLKYYEQNTFPLLINSLLFILRNAKNGNVLIWLCAFFIAGSCLRKNPYRIAVIKVSLLWLFCFISIVFTGGFHPHYAIQLLPFMSLLTGLFLAKYFSASRFLLAAFLAVPLVFSLGKTLHHYRLAWEKIQQGDSLFSGCPNDITHYLIQEGVEGEYVYLMWHHIAYWIANAKMPTRIAHPSNIARPFVHQTLTAMGYEEENSEKRFGHKPKFIVTPFPMSLIDDKLPEASAALRSELEKNYVFDRQLCDAEIYRRKEKHGGEGGI